MRLVTAVVLWLLTTVTLAVALPAAWAQKNVVDENGYAALAAGAAKNPQLQQAMAAELTTQAVELGRDSGYPLNREMVHTVAVTYTGNAGFPGQFAQANRIAHRWMFTDSTPQGDAADEWLVDIAPMLSDPSFTANLGDSVNLQVPDTLMVPVTVSSQHLRPGQLRAVSTWGPWVSVGAAVLSVVFALLTLAAARSRGKALAALGVSALLVGAAGWAGIEVGRRYVDDALNSTAGNIRQVADVMVNHAESGMHQWLNLTLAAGGALVVFGVLVTMLAGLRRRE